MINFNNYSAIFKDFVFGCFIISFYILIVALIIGVIANIRRENYEKLVNNCSNKCAQDLENKLCVEKCIDDEYKRRAEIDRLDKIRHQEMITELWEYVRSLEDDDD